MTDCLGNPMINLGTLHEAPPFWVDDEQIHYIDYAADVFTDKRELWEMVATCTPTACISAHYSSLSLRLIADWLQRRIELAEINGWNYEPWRLVSDLRLAAFTADAAINAGETLPRQPGEVL
jgi:hypothetical protein